SWTRRGHAGYQHQGNKQQKQEIKQCDAGPGGWSHYWVSGVSKTLTMYTRRAFLKSSGLGLLGIGLMGGVPTFVAEAVAREKNNPLYSKRRVIVCIFQRGAMDGLMAVSPFEDVYFREARPTLFMDVVQKASENPLIDLDGRFGLHPSMKAFEP